MRKRSPKIRVRGHSMEDSRPAQSAAPRASVFAMEPKETEKLIKQRWT